MYCCASQASMYVCVCVCVCVCVMYIIIMFSPVAVVMLHALPKPHPPLMCV